MTNNTTTIKLETSSYNQRRYGKPWIARVEFAADGKADFHWGEWVGRPGDAGTLVVTASEGDIVAEGRKDLRGNGTYTTYYQVREGKLVELANKAAAYKLATAPKPEPEPAPEPAAETPETATFDFSSMDIATLQALAAAVAAELGNRQ